MIPRIELRFMGKAYQVPIAAPHISIFSKTNSERLKSASIKEIVINDSIPNYELETPASVTVDSIGEIFARATSLIQDDKLMTELF